jgi:hypothetical protein
MNHQPALDKKPAGGWAVTLKSARQHGLHPEQLFLTPYYGIIREMRPEIFSAYALSTEPKIFLTMDQVQSRIP